MTTPKKCKTCEGHGEIFYKREELQGYVTRDMATDAQDMSLMDEPVYWEVDVREECPDCKGTGRYKDGAK